MSMTLFSALIEQSYLGDRLQFVRLESSRFNLLRRIAVCLRVTCLVHYSFW